MLGIVWRKIVLSGVSSTSVFRHQFQRNAGSSVPPLGSCGYFTAGKESRCLMLLQLLPSSSSLSSLYLRCDISWPYGRQVGLQIVVKVGRPCNVNFHYFTADSILPEKYSYYRKFDQDANRSTDCVICITAIDFSQRSNNCMVIARF